MPFGKFQPPSRNPLESHYPLETVIVDTSMNKKAI